MAPVDPYKKQEKTKIKVKLPEGTNYQMAPFHAGSNEDYDNHIIAMIWLIQKNDLKNSVEKVFVAASDIEEKVGPLYKKLNMSKSSKEKEGLKKNWYYCKRSWQGKENGPNRNREDLGAIVRLLCQQSWSSVGQGSSGDAPEGTMGRSEQIT